jgi:hypothetical protein
MMGKGSEDDVSRQGRRRLKRLRPGNEGAGGRCDEKQLDYMSLRNWPSLVTVAKRPVAVVTELGSTPAPRWTLSRRKGQLHRASQRLAKAVTSNGPQTSLSSY